MAKALSQEKIAEIRRVTKVGAPIRATAREYGVSPSTVSAIAKLNARADEERRVAFQDDISDMLPELDELEERLQQAGMDAETVDTLIGYAMLARLFQRDKARLAEAAEKRKAAMTR